MKNTLLQIFCVSIFVALGFLFPCGTALAASVGASYTSVSQNHVTFTVDIGSPAPTSLIIEHFHPTQSLLVNSSPRATKTNNRSGNAKWLLKNPRPGSYSFNLNFNGSISRGTVRLVIRYRNPQSGTFSEITIKP